MRIRLPKALASALLATLLLLPTALHAQHQTPTATATKDQPFGFKAYGVFGRMIQQQNYQPTVQLKDVADNATDAVGAVSGLRGEVTMIDGQLIVSYGLDCGTNCPAAVSESATLLATASAKHWRWVESDGDLDAKALEAFTRERAKPAGLDDKPFPFRIKG